MPEESQLIPFFVYGYSFVKPTFHKDPHAMFGLAEKITSATLCTGYEHLLERAANIK